MPGALKIDLSTRTCRGFHRCVVARRQNRQVDRRATSNNGHPQIHNPAGQSVERPAVFVPVTVFKRGTDRCCAAAGTGERSRNGVGLPDIQHVELDDFLGLFDHDAGIGETLLALSREPVNFGDDL